jgi:diphosphomevalonate decarboxylase
MERVRELRRAGTPAFYTMDAGPHVKVLCETARAEAVAGALRAVDGVERVIVSGAGPDAYVEEPACGGARRGSSCSRGRTRCCRARLRS